jgi:hypothetical protein
MNIQLKVSHIYIKRDNIRQHRNISHTIANTIRPSSHPKALTNLNRTKHRSATETKEIIRNTSVTTKMERLLPSSLNILSGSTERGYRKMALDSRSTGMPPTGGEWAGCNSRISVSGFDSKIALRRSVSATATSYEKERVKTTGPAYKILWHFFAATHDRPVLVATYTLLREWKRHTPYRRHCQVEICMQTRRLSCIPDKLLRHS